LRNPDIAGFFQDKVYDKPQNRENFKRLLKSDIGGRPAYKVLTRLHNLYVLGKRSELAPEPNSVAANLPAESLFETVNNAFNSANNPVNEAAQLLSDGPLWQAALDGGEALQNVDEAALGFDLDDTGFMKKTGTLLTLFELIYKAGSDDPKDHIDALTATGGRIARGLAKTPALIAYYIIGKTGESYIDAVRGIESSLQNNNAREIWDHCVCSVPTAESVSGLRSELEQLKKNVRESNNFKTIGEAHGIEVQEVIDYGLGQRRDDLGNSRGEQRKSAASQLTQTFAIALRKATLSFKTAEFRKGQLSGGLDVEVAVRTVSSNEPLVTVTWNRPADWPNNAAARATLEVRAYPDLATDFGPGCV